MKNGYMCIGVDRKQRYAHRMAWLYMTGEMPEDQVDHINGIRTDNRWCNLRAANDRLNCENKHGPQSNNTSGYRGVWWSKINSRWIAEIWVNGKKNRIGSFTCVHEAGKAYLEAKRKLHEGCTI